MRKNIFILFILLVCSGLWAQYTELDAGSIKIGYNEDNGGNIFISEETVKDYLAAGNNVSYTGIADDLYLMGRRLEFDGQSIGSMSAFGEKVNINGDITKNLHTIGNSVKINSHIKETVFAAGEDIVVSKDSVIDGTLFAGASSLHVLGKLNNGLVGGAGEIIIDGPIEGNVNVRTGKLIITERGSINGDLTYGSKTQLSKIESNRISGSIEYIEDEVIEKKDISKFIVIAGILFYLSLIAGGLLLLLIPGIKSSVSKDRESGSYLRTMLWGLIPVFIYPVLTIISIPLFPISLALGLAAFPLLGVSTVIGLALGGQYLFKLFKWENNNVYLQFLFALVAFAVVSIIPFIKVILCLGVLSMGAGIIISKLFRVKF